MVPSQALINLLPLSAAAWRQLCQIEARHRSRLPLQGFSALWMRQVISACAGMSSTKQFVRMCANSRSENRASALIELSSMHGLMHTLSVSRLIKQ